MEYRIIPVTPFEQNCTLLWCTETMKGAFVDPGGDIERLLAASANLGVSIEKILLTHGHIDHAGGAANAKKPSGSTSWWRRPKVSAFRRPGPSPRTDGSMMATR